MVLKVKGLDFKSKRVFGHRLGIYHSKFPDAERVEIWQKQLGEKSYDVILGVRSSIFLPFRNLGLVLNVLQRICIKRECGKKRLDLLEMEVVPALILE